MHVQPRTEPTRLVQKPACDVFRLLSLLFHWLLVISSSCLLPHSTKERLEGGRKKVERRQKGDWKEAGRRLEGGMKEAGRRQEGDWKEAGRRLEGGWKEAAAATGRCPAAGLGDASSSLSRCRQASLKLPVTLEAGLWCEVTAWSSRAFASSGRLLKARP